MPHYVDPSTFLEHPLFLRAIAENDYAVVVAGISAGRIMMQPRAGHREIWFWTLTGPHLPEHLRPGNGEEGSLGEAKAAFRKKFNAWLGWADGLQHEVVWNMGVQRQGPA